MTERLQKVMAEFGVASRRKCEEMIAAGKVKVNGYLITEPGTKVDKEKDAIEVDGKIIKCSESRVYILLNKPVGYITSAKDQFGRPTVLDLLKGISVRVFPIGRLDYDTEGLILLTNDGDLTYRITHPKHNIDKTYRALIDGEAGTNDIENFKNGIAVEDYVASPAKLEIIRHIKGNSIVDITIHEGKNRQVRKMCAAIGHEVIWLKRIKIGKIELGELKIGEWRYLSDAEVEYLKALEG
jgi:23S rRNA pseudouridine2605 synthase